jgi:hypothetical protein
MKYVYPNSDDLFSQNSNDQDPGAEQSVQRDAESAFVYPGHRICHACDHSCSNGID